MVRLASNLQWLEPGRAGKLRAEGQAKIAKPHSREGTNEVGANLLAEDGVLGDHLDVWRRSRAC